MQLVIKKTALAAALSLLTLSIASAQAVIYVNVNAAPGGDGTSWQAAYQDLQAGLDDAVGSLPNASEIWIAEGTYLPSVQWPSASADPRTVTFELPDKVALYGGFVGSEAGIDDRAGSFLRTILSGDIGVGGSITDNAYHVVVTRDTGWLDPVILDGVTITAGNADMTPLAFPDGNFGGGALIEGASVEFRNCWFIDNQATLDGGGIWVGNSVDRNASRFRFGPCQAINNTATRDGAMPLGSSIAGASLAAGCARSGWRCGAFREMEFDGSSGAAAASLAPSRRLANTGAKRRCKLGSTTGKR